MTRESQIFSPSAELVMSTVMSTGEAKSEIETCYLIILSILLISYRSFENKLT